MTWTVLLILHWLNIYFHIVPYLSSSNLYSYKPKIEPVQKEFLQKNELFILLLMGKEDGGHKNLDTLLYVHHQVCPRLCPNDELSTTNNNEWGGKFYVLPTTILSSRFVYNVILTRPSVLRTSSRSWKRRYNISFKLEVLFFSICLREIL